jgi:hypothetical protein
VQQHKDNLFTQLDDMFNKVAFENAAIQTDFKHEFKEDKIVDKKLLPNAESSPYQTLIQHDNQIQIRSE